MRAILLAAAFLLAALSGCGGEEARRAVIETRDGATHSFSVELALTPEEQRQGLMYRRELAEDAGMLFFYPACARAAFWMKNTYIPLDMIFIRANGVIGHIAENTTPLSEATISSNGPVKGVLEVIGGTAKRLGIAAGDRVEHPFFGG